MRGLCPLPLLLPVHGGPDQLLPVYQRRKSPFQRQGEGLSVLVEVPQKLIQRQGTQYQWFMWKPIPGNTSRGAGSKQEKEGLRSRANYQVSITVGDGGLRMEPVEHAQGRTDVLESKLPLPPSLGKSMRGWWGWGGEVAPVFQEVPAHGEPEEGSSTLEAGMAAVSTRGWRSLSLFSYLHGIQSSLGSSAPLTCHHSFSWPVPWLWRGSGAVVSSVYGQNYGACSRNSYCEALPLPHSVPDFEERTLRFHEVLGLGTQPVGLVFF